LREHIAKDVAVTNPCQIILAQEVDAEFIQLLQSTETHRHVPILAVASAGSSSSGPVAAGVSSSSSSPAVAGADSDRWMIAGVTGGSGDPYAGWHVVRGEEEGPTCIVAGKRSMFKSITRLEWHRTSGGAYKTKSRKTKGGRGGGEDVDKPVKPDVEAWSRILVAELEFWRPCAGFMKLRVASVHMHRMPAKRQSGFCRGGG
jgi:hypothetical protein